MEKQIKKFGKIINNNPTIMRMYQTQKSYINEINQLQKIKSDKIIIWAKMEGKYSTEVISDHVWSERGYYYQYPNEETKEKEEMERNIFHNENIAPLEKRIKELYKKVDELNECICIELWGFNSELYSLYEELINAKEELERQKAYVEKLQKNFIERVDKSTP